MVVQDDGPFAVATTAMAATATQAGAVAGMGIGVIGQTVQVSAAPGPTPMDSSAESDPGIRDTINPSQDNIIYREWQLEGDKISRYDPFDQGLSDTGGQPIRIVVTADGNKYIMQGNHRVYGAAEQGLQSIEGIVYTPEQWEAFTGSPFNPTGTNNPGIN